MPENSEICCICLKNCLIYRCVCERASDHVQYIEKLGLCLPNEQWLETFRICEACIVQLDTAYIFIQLCLKSEAYRKEQLLKKEVSEEGKYEVASTNFTCYECNKTFRLKRTLGLHITRIHKEKHKSQLSKDCDIDSQTKNHIKLENINNLDSDNESKIQKEFRRDIKEDSNDDIKQYSDFELDTNDFDQYFSDEDGSKLKKSYKGKKRGPKLKTPQKCPYCELEFSRTDRYIHHVRSKHTFEKPFKCTLCDSKYYSQHNLNIHMRKHRNERPFVCSSCGKCFTSSNDLWQHNKIHDKVRQYACDECDRSFKTHSNLRTHKLQMHQDPGVWKFVCTVCGKKFPLNNNLIKHMRRHEGIKDFMCHLCDKRFVEKVDLQSHLLSHSNERHFKCSVCLKEYKKNETLRRHMKMQHDLGNFVVKKPEKKLTCPMCPKIFAFNNKLQRHILTHTGEKPFKCDCCEKRFRDNYDRNSHLRQAHNIEPKQGTLQL